MRLAAIYIKNHFLFPENCPQIINLGGKYLYDIELEKGNENKLIVKKRLNPDFMDGFFGDNIQLLSAIVGSNGSGKSSLLFEIYNSYEHIINFSEPLNKYKTLFIYEDENEIVIKTKIYIKISENEDYSYDKNKPKEINRTELTLSSRFSNNSDLILVDLTTFDKDKESIFYYYYNPLYLNHKANGNVSNSKIADILDEIIFFSNQELIEKINTVYKDIHFYKSFSIKANEAGSNLRIMESSINSNYTKQFDHEDKLYSHIKDESKIDNNYYFFNHLYKIYTDLIKDIHFYDVDGVAFQSNSENNIKLFEVYYHVIARLFTHCLSDFDLYVQLCKNFLDRVNIEEFKSKKRFLKLLSDIIVFIHSSDKKINQKDKLFYESVLTFVDCLPEDLILILNKTNLENNKKLIESYIEIVNTISLLISIQGEPTNQDFINKYFLIFIPEFNISDGERFLIKLFSKLYSNKFYNSKMSVENYLLLDEPEIGFHPQWKKKYIDAILKCLPIILESTEQKKLQIIFTTHDPLTLSDLPNNNVVYLKKNEHTGFSEVLTDDERPQKSFGANITDLLADSFFINDGLIGDFAKGKINEIIEWLQNENRDFKKKVEILKTIKIIDEPIMKIKLEEMYYSIFSGEYNIVKEKEYILKRAIELGLINEEND